MNYIVPRKVIFQLKFTKNMLKPLRGYYHGDWNALFGKSWVWNPVISPIRFLKTSERLLDECDVCPKERDEVSISSCVKSKHTGMTMPALILGTWKTDKLEVAEKALSTAFRVGYRAIDTSTHYGNEMVLGCAMEPALTSAKLKREDIFIITKLPFDAMRCEKVLPTLCKSLQMLRTSYVDLYMINFPAGSCKDDKGNYQPDLSIDHSAIWKAMEDAVESGKTKYIGVCNFSCNQLEELMSCAKVKPSNVQIELHAYFQQKTFRRFAKEMGVTVTAFAPLGRSPALEKWLKEKGEKGDGKPSPVDDPVIADIAKKNCKTPQQLLVRFVLQMDDSLAVVVGASDPKVICDNIQIFDFNLNAEDKCLLKNLDKGKKARLFDKSVFKHHFPGVDCHPLFPWKD